MAKFQIGKTGLKVATSKPKRVIHQYNPAVNANQFSQLNRAGRKYVNKINKMNQKAFQNQLTEGRKLAREQLIARYGTINNAIAQFAPGTSLYQNNSQSSQPTSQGLTMTNDSESTNVMKFIK